MIDDNHLPISMDSVLPSNTTAVPADMTDESDLSLPHNALPVNPYIRPSDSSLLLANSQTEVPQPILSLVTPSIGNAESQAAHPLPSGGPNTQASTLTVESVTLNDSAMTIADDNPLPARQYFGRYTWKVQAPSSKNPLAALANAIQEVWDALFCSDASLVIYPWAESAGSDESKALCLPEQCPSNKSALQEYFEKAYPRPDGGNYYISVRLGHERPTQELRQASADFFESEQN